MEVINQKTNTKKERIYTITRKDISPAQKAVQSMHAGMQYMIDHNPHLDYQWNNGSIICLELGTEKALRRWIKKLEDKGIKISIFREPDMNHEITAIAALHHGDIFHGIPLI